jgi:signal transduction histidine kinase
VPLNRQINKLVRLVNELLDVTRIEEGKITLKKSTFDFNQLVDEIIKDVSSGNVKHDFIVKGQKDIQIHADRDRIGQVLTNLLSNAIKYSPDGKKVIIKLDPNPGRLVVSVQDFGIGIARSYRKSIFDRFYQIESTDSKPSTNLGLGLYIAKELVEHHGGKIWVESKEGGGSTFFFKLPV